MVISPSWMKVPLLCFMGHRYGLEKQKWRCWWDTQALDILWTGQYG